MVLHDVIAPTADEAAELQANFESQCFKAADALAEADVLLLVTGAGWGADSGLAVYGDIANIPAYQKRGLEYSDVCQPHWVGKDPETFYGFWGQCYNDYRTTKPHAGFDIVARWRDDKNNNKQAAEKIRKAILEKVERDKPFDSYEVQRLTPYHVPDGPAARSFYCFTSNVDGHFYDKFEANEIHDCHGCIELWQCSDRDCTSGIWRAPTDFKFTVDQETMLAPPYANKKGTEELKATRPHSYKNNGNCSNSSSDDVAAAPGAARLGKTTGKERRDRHEMLQNMPEAIDQVGWYQADGDHEDSNTTSNWPKCGHCQSLARPAIFMFGDFGWKYDESQYLRWELWRDTVIEASAASEEDSVKVCVIEVGCGGRVRTCRSTSEEMVLDVRKKGGEATLIRINPDFPMTEDEFVKDSLIPIMSRGLRAIRRIDEIYREK